MLFWKKNDTATGSPDIELMILNVSMMKRIAYIVLPLLLMAACQKDVPLGQETVRLMVEGEEATATRTTYDNDTGAFLWSEGDRIALHYSSGAYDTPPVDASTGQVLATLYSSSQRDYYAVCPASAAVASNYGNPTLQLTLPASYDISDVVAGTSSTPVEHAPCPMVASNNPQSDVLNFHHVGGLARITILTPSKSIATVSVTFDTDVTGTYAVSAPATSTPAISTQGSAGVNNEVTFTVAGTEGIGAGKRSLVLNVPVPTGTYATMRVYSYDGEGVLVGRAVAYNITFERRHGKKFWLLYSETLSLEGEDLVWQDNLNEGEDLRWEGDVLNWGEGLIWK